MNSALSNLLLISALSGLIVSACGGSANATPTGQAPGVVVDDFAVIAEGRLLPRQSVQLSFSTGGKVAEVLVAEGARLAEGDVIARLENSAALQSQVAQAQLELLNAQQALKDLQDSAAMVSAQAQLEAAQAQDNLDKARRRLRNLSSPDIEFYQDQVDRAQDALMAAQQNVQITDIGALQTALTAAKDALEDATNRLNDLKDQEARYPGCCTDQVKDAQKAYDQALKNVQIAELQLAQAQTGSSNAVEDAQKALDDALAALARAQGSPDALAVAVAQANVAVAEAALAEAQAHYAKVQSGPDPDQWALAQARASTAQAGLAAAQAALANSELRTPMAGTLAELKLKAGEQVGTGQPVATVADLSTWIVETDNLTEIEVVKVREGQGAGVTLDALPGETLRGQVTSISSVFEETHGDITYRVTIALQDQRPPMRWGMTAEVTFDR